MGAFDKKSITLLFTVCFSLCFIVGCSSTNETRRGKLSDAMDKASEENKEDRKVPTEPSHPTPVAEGAVNSEETSPDTSSQPIPERHEDVRPESSQGKSLSPLWVGLRFGGGTLKAGAFEAIGEFGILVGSYFGDRAYGEVWGFFSAASLTETASLNKSIKDGVAIFGIGIEGKYFLTPSYTFMGPYLLGGLNFSHMTWDYRKAITANTYDNYGNVIRSDRITNDGLSGLDMFVGAGFHLFQFSGLHIGAEITPGLILWSNTTSEGFDNDVFNTFFYLKLRAHVSFGL